MAESIFAQLGSPSIQDNYHGDARENLRADVREIVDHAALAAKLGKPTPTYDAPSDPATAIFQMHIAALGELAGEAASGVKSKPLHITEVSQALLTFLDNVAPAGASNAYQVSKIRSATTRVVRTLLQTGALYSDATFDAIANGILDLCTIGDGNLRANLAARREIVEIIFKYRSDADAAAEQLEAAFAELAVADTPREEVDEIAGFAASFALIGKDARAREILGQIHRQTLGYYLAPKKDPQYIFWRETLKRACEADPAHRASRVRFMTRLLAGMAKTEGSSTAYRLSSAVIDEAARETPALAAAVLIDLQTRGLTTWWASGDAVLRGVIARRPELTFLAVKAWTTLVLPYYQEYHFQEDRLGGFIGIAFESVPDGEAGHLVKLLLPEIEAQSVQECRVDLLMSLAQAARAKSAPCDDVEKALDRWRKEGPRKDNASTSSSDELRDAKTLEDLSARLNSADQAHSLMAPDHVARLAETAEPAEIEHFLHSHPKLEGDGRVLFARAGAALKRQDRKQAKALLEKYRPEEDSRASWDPWMGAAKLEFHRLLVELGGASARAKAYEVFANDLAQGRGFILSLITDLADVVDVISSNDLWPEIWSSLREFLSQFREFELGEDQEIDNSALPSSDEALLAFMYDEAFGQHISDLAYHARVGATQSLNFAGVWIYSRSSLIA